jgi:hypothetical protein
VTKKGGSSRFDIPRKAAFCGLYQCRVSKTQQLKFSLVKGLGIIFQAVIVMTPTLQGQEISKYTALLHSV